MDQIMVPVITHQQIQFIQSLRISKYRQRYQKFVIEGDKICSERLVLQDVKIDSIYALPGWISNRTLQTKGYPVYQINQSQLKKISNFKTPNQVVIVCDIPTDHTFTPSFKKTLCFYLDDIRDPGNMGTIIRTLDWFGFRQIFHSPQCVDCYNPKVLQASMGSIFNVQLQELSYEEFIRLEDIPLIGTAISGKNLGTFSFPEHGLLVIGNESRGINPKLSESLTQTISIPKKEKATAESLNAAVACAIIAYAASV